MDSSDGANTNGNGHADPSPVSQPSAAPSSGNGGGPVAAPSEGSTVGSLPVKRDEKGRYPKGVSGNPKGNWKRTPTFNSQLIRALKTFKLTDGDGKDHSFLEALIRRALQEPKLAEKLMDKIFADATPPAEAAKLEINNGNGQVNTSSENHVILEKLASDERGRETLALLAERLSDSGLFPGSNGNGH